MYRAICALEWRISSNKNAYIVSFSGCGKMRGACILLVFCMAAVTVWVNAGKMDTHTQRDIAARGGSLTVDQCDGS